MTFTKHLALTAVAALLGTTAASAQMFGDTYGTDYDYDTFNTGFGESGYYDALDTDDDVLLSESEYTTGLYADYDRDNDVLISEEEFGLGTDRYYGGAYEGGLFSDYDADADGFLNQEEFGGFYETEYRQNYTGYDTDADGFLSQDEYSTGLYGSADMDQDEILTVEEEGWFEGWFDGDDIETEVMEVGEVYTGL